MRIGIGYDIHALKKGRRFVLGGVHIPFSKGPFGHSDGDVLFHAVIDAALGAAGLGDIGEHFSDKDRRWKDADSSDFGSKTVRMLKEKGYKIQQIDTIILLEAPKLLQWKQKIRKKTASVFQVPFRDVSVKAKTHEGFGAIGRNQAVACHAAVTLARSKKTKGNTR